MVKRLSTIGIIICLATAVWGYSTFDSQQFLYQLKNGSPLVKDGFIEQIRNAIAKDPKFSKKYCLCSIAENSFSITDSENDYMVYAEIEKNKKFYVSQSRNPGDPLVSHGFNPSKAKRFEDVSMVELNRMIDEKIFPDVKTRGKRKLEILNRID